MAIAHHPSPEIREFLALYLLERASLSPFAPADLAREVERNSGGDLCPAEEDLHAARTACWERGWLDCDHPLSERPASLTPEGRSELARLRDATGGGSPDSDPRRQAADLLVSQLPPLGRGPVLDVGTGDGFLACRAAAAGFGVLAIDINREAIANAGCDTKPGDSVVRFQVADIRDLSRQGARFSGILASYLLHECDDPTAVLEAICTCLSPGGFLGSMDLAPNSAAYLTRAGRTPFHPFRALANGDWRHLAPRFGLAGLECFTVGHVAVATAHKTNGRAHSRPPIDNRRKSP